MDMYSLFYLVLNQMNQAYIKAVAFEILPHFILDI